MAVLQMQRFSICAMKKNRKAILEELQALGIMEIDTSIVEDAALRKANTLEVRQGFDKKAVQIDHALEILQEYAPEKTSMFSSLEGRALVEKSEYDQITEGKDKVLESANELLTLKKQLTENKAKAVKVENQIESLEPWLSLDIPMGYQGTKFTAVLIGSFGGQLTLEQIYERLAQEAPELEAMDIQVISSDQDQTCVTVFCLRDQATKMEEALRSMGFSKPSMVTDEIPSKQKEKLEQMRNDFLGNVSHELKTPLALIQGYAEGLKDGVTSDPESMDFYCDVIIDEASKMNNMVRNLLTLNQLEFGDEDITFERFDLTAVIRGVIQSMDIMAQQGNATVNFRRDEPVYVWADEFKVEQVIRNYMSNAFHHLNGEKIVEVKIYMEESRAKVTVFNTGSPIPEEDLNHIWDKFYKVDKAHTREYGGNGIGLSIVKAIMESFHQEYGVKNYENGVEFWFTLDRK